MFCTCGYLLFALSCIAVKLKIQMGVPENTRRKGLYFKLYHGHVIHCELRQTQFHLQPEPCVFLIVWLCLWACLLLGVYACVHICLCACVCVCKCVKYLLVEEQLHDYCSQGNRGADKVEKTQQHLHPSHTQTHTHWAVCWRRFLSPLSAPASNSISYQLLSAP